MSATTLDALVTDTSAYQSMTNSIGRTRGRTAKKSPRGSLVTLTLSKSAMPARPTLTNELFTQPGQDFHKSHYRTNSNTSSRSGRRERQKRSILEAEEEVEEELWRAPVRSFLKAVQMRLSQGLTEFLIMLRRPADFQDLTESQMALFSEQQTAERVILQCTRKLRKKGIRTQFKLVLDANLKVTGISCKTPVEELKSGICKALDTLREEAKQISEQVPTVSQQEMAVLNISTVVESEFKSQASAT